ncbi:MAG: hypothetical protein ACJ74O_13510 [Frankiaceae bacterium]|jgi:hypothetical protein
MARTEFVTLVHDVTGGRADFPVQAVPLWKEKGWAPATDAPPPDPALFDPALFDPARYSVAEVQAYLESASDEERQRVIAAERAGQKRKTILGE